MPCIGSSALLQLLLGKSAVPPQSSESFLWAYLCCIISLLSNCINYSFSLQYDRDVSEEAEGSLRLWLHTLKSQRLSRANRRQITTFPFCHLLILFNRWRTGEWRD